jgi:peptidoglycan/xylan/chitin deacetylase (PgdA/CDA1 family)
MASSRWPNGAEAAVSITVDNLGEAQELNAGTWPSDKPIGHHFSATTAIPRMLKIFDENDTKATFFFESWSMDIYPDVLQEVRSHKHEIGWHGFQHESWPKLSEEKENDNFSRSFARAAKFEIKYDGFRPPGGLINDRTYQMLQERGLRYFSPVAQRAAISRGLAVLPFHWKTVDATYYMDLFQGLRKLYSISENETNAESVKKAFLEQVEEAVRANAYVSILFHPFLQTSEERLAVVKEVVETIKKDPRVWCAPCTEVADWVLQHPNLFGSDPGLIHDSW